ncbi:hypothetical protein GCM10007173_13810 [Glutamicibacter ardleyensis]|uniref:HTH cro/C1-type domain-containing protein n=1 Tax=Glutamicibacter ardleyensis TaxID=225894 RepID=A0ABQ2DGA4_9MICC|nr:hypothetical protein GCM10007173_13810 [Glutamicibacter ardleyensis]
MYITPGLLDKVKKDFDIPSDEELSKLLGCSRSTLHRIDTHEQGVTARVSTLLHTRFSIPLEDIATTSEGRIGRNQDPIPDSRGSGGTAQDQTPNRG